LQAFAQSCMPVTTRRMAANEEATAFARALKEILGVQSDSHPISRLLLDLGVSTVTDFAMLRPEDFTDATYADKETTANPNPPVPTKDKNMLKGLREWLREQGTTDLAPWNALTKDSFMKFIVQGPTPTIQTDVPSATPPTMMTSVANFQRSIA